MAQKAAALHIACDVRWIPRRLEGVRNPTDAGSRRTERGEVLRYFSQKRGGVDRRALRLCEFSRKSEAASTAPVAPEIPASAAVLETSRQPDLPSPFTSASSRSQPFLEAPAGEPGSPLQAPPPPRRVTRRRQFFLELFGGEGGITHAVRRERVRAGPCFEIRQGPAFDLSRPSIRALIVKWIVSGLVFAVWLGTPCTCFLWLDETY